MNYISRNLALSITSILRLGCGLALLLTAGCVTPPPVEEVIESGPIFYPALPDTPRIQYLTTFSSSKDIRQPVEGFSSFILGKDQDKDAYYINKPYGVQIHDGIIYAVDIRGNGYAVMDLVNLKFDFVRGDGAGRMAKPINITIDKDGSKYISDAGLQKVLLFDKNDRFVQAFGVSGQFKPVDSAISGDKLFVVDIKDHEIEVLNKHSGVLLYKIGKPGADKGDLYHPTNIKIGMDNHVYVSDTTNFRVQKFTIDGRYVKSFGSVGTGGGQFARPKGIALDRQDRLYVVDAAFENVQVMSPDGELLMFFGSPGGSPDNINLPADIEIDYENTHLFQGYAHPDFKLEYIILVSSQFGINKVNVFGFGRMKGMDYVDDSTQSSVND